MQSPISLSNTLLRAVESHLQQVVQRYNRPNLKELYEMMAYHLGWIGEGAGPEATGKRIRPVLLLLTTAAAGGDWEQALPAAAAIELVHNFSLIHDDIEDNSPLRRGRVTVWKKWGLAQAINTGDAMYTLAHLALTDLEQTSEPAQALLAYRVLHSTCLHLTEGQYLDMSYEGRDDLAVEHYWPMVGGKTASLIAACTEMGAILGGASQETCTSYRQFGYSLGLAFQALDDLLGIWGDAALTGKSAESDLVSGKKSLPVLFGLEQKGEFARLWSCGPVHPEAVAHLAQVLENEGARAFTLEKANQLTDQALQALDQAAPQGEAGQELRQLARKLLQRQA